MWRCRRESDAVLLQLLRALAQADEGLLGKLRPPATGFGGAAVGGDAFAKGVPTHLHFPRVALQSRHLVGGALLAACGFVECRCCGLNLRQQLGQMRLIFRHLLLPARFLVGNGRKVSGEAGAPPLGVLRRLFEPPDVRTEPVVACLHFGEGIDSLLMSLLGGLHPAFHAEAGSTRRFDLGVEGDEGLVAACQLLVGSIQAQQAELGELAAFLLLEVAIALGVAGLALQAVQLPPEFVAQVVDSRQMFAGMGKAVVGLAATLPILGNASRLFEKGPQFVRLGVRQLADHALLDDRVAARAEAGAQKDAANVASATSAAVEVVGRLAVPRQFPAHGDFAECRVLTADAGVLVVEQKLHRGHAGGLPRARTLEDHVHHRIAAQLLRGAFAHCPTHGVDDVRLAAADRPDDGVAVAGERNRRRIDEGLEPGEPDFL